MVRTEHWLSYTEWSTSLTKATHENFLKAAELGVYLGEVHLVSNAAVYLWNYNHHLLESNTVVELIPTYKTLLTKMRKMPKMK